MTAKSTDLIPEKRILNIIMLIRGEKVILDSDLAELYGVETRRINEQVRRNIAKFPEDFMFQLTGEEFADLKSQIATPSYSWGGRRKRPLVFTEYGALQAADVFIGWTIKRQRGTSHRVFARPGWPDYVFAFHDREEIGPKMLARIAKHTGLTPQNL